MQSPSVEFVDSTHIYISGNVVVHPSAAIAPGVLLQADPGCQLIIAAGVCIGQGVVLHAHRGSLAIETGTTLGSGVLIIGQGQIGANACIGAFTTILNSSVAADQIVPPRSLIGEAGRQVALEAVDKPTAASGQPAVGQSAGQPAAQPAATDALPDPWTDEAAPAAPDFKTGFISGFSAPGSTRNTNGSRPYPEAVPQPASQPPSDARSDPSSSVPMSVPKTPTQVYGQAYVERIMIAMFPHRRLTEPPDSKPDRSADSSSTHPPP